MIAQRDMSRNQSDPDAPARLKARLERDRRDEDGFEYIDDPQ